MKKTLRILLPACLALVLLCACSDNGKNEFCIGADISWLPSQEDMGIRFSDNGEEADALQILKNHHFNWIRLRLFVDPTAVRGYSPQGYCGLEQTIAMGQRIKKAGMKFLLDFHYSDTWADPGKQFKPNAWMDLTGEALEAQIYSYTQEVIRTLIKEGAAPDMVQIGNEINHGIIWPDGQISDDDYAPLAGLLRKAGDGVRDASRRRIPIMLHIACGGQNDESVHFLDKMQELGVSFDVIGESYYPRWHGTLEELQANLEDLSARYQKPIYVVEYQDYALEVNEIVKALPNGLGAGTFIWEATSPMWGGLFDREGHSTEKILIYDEFVQAQ